MRSIVATQNVINIGYQGENNAACVQFNVSGWKELYGEGSYTLLVKRHGDADAYPVSVQASDNAVTWIVSNGDTARAGNGSAELVYSVDGTIAKSVIYRTCVLPSLDGSAEPPEPWESWVQDVLEASADAVEAATNAEEAAEKAAAAVAHEPIIVNGTWWIWSQQDEEYVDTHQPSRGADGETIAVEVNGETFTQVNGTVDIGTVIREHQSLSAYRTATAQDAIDATKQDKPTISTTVPASAVSVNTHYFLGTLASLTITLPTQDIAAGDLVVIVFYSGSTKTTLTFTGATNRLGDDVTPNPNERIELNMLYDGTNWAIVSNAMEVTP